MTKTNLRHGIFLAPYHSMEESPATCYQQDFELLEWMDRLGFHEAWIGEHHSAGYEIISSPELFIAAAAERTKRMMFGTGVVSLPYHNPLTAANRLIQLDHMTRGRIMVGLGPGALVSDALMFGIDPSTQRDRLNDGLEIIMRLFRGETVTKKSDWYNLVNARLHLLPYQYPHPEIAVASANTSSGGRLAGKYGLGMLCFVTGKAGFDALHVNWLAANEVAAENGVTMDASRVRVVLPLHIAETRDKARENVQHGLENFVKFANGINPGRYPAPAGKNLADWFNEEKLGVIGTPDDAIAMIESLIERHGEFGAFCQTGHDWADWQQTRKSYELYARYVMPHFAGTNHNRTESFEWASKNAVEFQAKRSAAAAKFTAETTASDAMRIEHVTDIVSLDNSSKRM